MTAGEKLHRRFLAAYTATSGYKHCPEIVHFYAIDDDRVEVAVRGPEDENGVGLYVAMTMPRDEFTKMLKRAWAALGFPGLGEDSPIAPPPSAKWRTRMPEQKSKEQMAREDLGLVLGSSPGASRRGE